MGKLHGLYMRIDVVVSEKNAPYQVDSGLSTITVLLEGSHTSLEDIGTLVIGGMIEGAVQEYMNNLGKLRTEPSKDPSPITPQKEG